jgi:hypothetical protein
MVYSADFAKRFGLSDRGVYKFGGDGLQAITLRVVQRIGSPPSCLLDLYVDDSLDVVYPDGSEGKRVQEDISDPLFFVKDEVGQNVGPMQRRWNDTSLSFHSEECYRSPRDCLVEGGAPEAFYRSLLPALSLLTYELTCYAFDPKYGPADIWLLRSGHDARALNVRSTDTAATRRYSVPLELLKHAAPRTRDAAALQGRTWPQPIHTSFTVPPRSGS